MVLKARSELAKDLQPYRTQLGLDLDSGLGNDPRFRPGNVPKSPKQGQNEASDGLGTFQIGDTE